MTYDATPAVCASRAGRFAYGNCCQVKKMTSLQISRLEIEIPVEYHKEAVALLDGEDCVVIPRKLAQAYGIHEVGESAEM